MLVRGQILIPSIETPTVMAYGHELNCRSGRIEGSGTDPDGSHRNYLPQCTGTLESNGGAGGLDPLPWAQSDLFLTG